MGGGSVWQRVAAVIAFTLTVGACSAGGSGSPANDAVASRASTEGSGTLEEVSVSTGGETDSSSVESTPTGPTSSQGGSTSVATVPTTSVAPGQTPSAGEPSATSPAPDTSEPDGMPGPPAADCADAADGPARVELSFGDDQVLYEGVAAPTCVRVHAAQQVVLRNIGSLGATVLIGGESFTVATGTSVATAPLGATHDVGDVFDVYFESLDISLVVQVLP